MGVGELEWKFCIEKGSTEALPLDFILFSAFPVIVLIS